MNSLAAKKCKRNHGEKGFTLIEALIAICVGGILIAIAAPLYSRWVASTAQKEAAHRLAVHIKETRSKAITQNLEHRLEVDLQKNQYRITHGNRPHNSSDSSWAANVVMDWQTLGNNLNLKANVDCSLDVASDAVNSLEYLSFNGDGTSNTRYFCIEDPKDTKIFRIGVPFTGTGNLVIETCVRGSCS